MKNAKELKKHAISRLNCCWGEVVFIFFIKVGGITAFLLAWALTANFLKVSGVVDFNGIVFDLSNGVLLAVTIFSVIALWAVYTPFDYGAKWFKLQQIRGKSLNARGIFSCYSSEKRVMQVLKLNGLVMLGKLAVFLPLCGLAILGFYIFGNIRAGGSDGAISVVSSVCIQLLISCMLCLLWAINLKYAAVPYLYALDPECPPKEIIRKSKLILKDNPNYLVESLLSLAWWIIPALMIFTLVFIIPYFQMVHTAAVNELIEAYESEKHIEREDAFAERV